MHKSLAAKKLVCSFLAVAVAIPGFLLGFTAFSAALADPVYNDFETNPALVQAYYGNINNAPKMTDYGINSNVVTESGIGHGGSGGAMRLSYSKNHTGTTPQTGMRAMFSIANTNLASYSSYKPENNKFYRVSLWYKAEKLNNDAEILLTLGAGALNAAQPSRQKTYIMATAPATEASGEWAQASVIIEGKGINAIVELNLANHLDRIGASVLIDDVTVQEVQSPITVSFQTNGGNEISDVLVIPGEEISFPADPVKAGFNFSGWYKDEALSTPCPTTMAAPESNITLYAKWAEAGLKQSYEAFEAKTYDIDNTDGIRGNGSGRTISSLYNHTSGGAKSAELRMNRDNKENYARTVVNFNGVDYKADKTLGYKISFWAYSPEDISFSYYIGSVGNPVILFQNINHSEAQGITHLKAGVWQQITVVLNGLNGAGSANTYLTIGGAFPGASDSNVKLSYIDDVEIETFVLTDIDYGVQSYESFETKTYGAAEAGGIHGNGSGRTVAADYNHSAGGSKSLKFTMNRDGYSNYAQSIVNFDGVDLQLVKGSAYMIKFWVLSPQDITLTWRVASAGGPLEFIAQYHQIEKEGKVQLKAGKWKQITVKINNAIGTQGSNFMTLGLLFPGASDADIRYAYVDDVEVVAVKNIPKLIFHTGVEGLEQSDMNAFEGEPLGSLPYPVRDGYILDGWFSQDNTEAYDSSSIMPENQSALNLYARWSEVPATPYSFSTGFEVTDYNSGIHPYLNTNEETNHLRNNMTENATWLTDAGFAAETGDGSMRLINTPFVNEEAKAYPAFALINPDGSRFMVIKGNKYKISYSYMGDEVNSAHSYVTAIITPKNTFEGVGADEQLLRKNAIHGVTDWFKSEEYFYAESTGFVYISLAARSSTSQGSSEHHVANIDNVKVQALGDSYVSLHFKNGASTVAARVGEKGKEVSFPPQPVKDGHEFSGWYSDAELTSAYTSWKYPQSDTVLYAGFTPADYSDGKSDFSKPITLSFEETDILKNFLWSPNHMSWVDGEIEFVTNDSAKARTGNNYIQWNAIEWHYYSRQLMFYDPNSKYNILYLEPNTSYRISYWFQPADEFTAVSFNLAFNNPSGVQAENVTVSEFSSNIDDNISPEVWQKAEHLVTTSSERVSVSLNTFMAEFTCKLDDITIAKTEEVTVKFNANGGSAVEDVKVYSGNKIEMPFEPYREGYTFAGWYTDAALTKAFDFDKTEINEALTMYAKWKAIEVPVAPPTEEPKEEESTNKDRGDEEPSDSGDDNAPSGPSKEQQSDDEPIDNGTRPVLLEAEPVAGSPEVPVDMPEKKGFPWLPVAAGGAAVLLAAGGSILFLLLRKRKVRS